MKRFITLFCLLPSIAWGQAAVQQTGPITNNSPVMWARDHVVRQAAGAAGDVAGKMITGGFSAVGNVCSYSNTTDQSGIGLCLDGANGQLVYNGIGYPVSGGGGNVVGPSSSVANEVAGFNNLTGTLLKGTGARQFSGADATFLFDPAQPTQQQFKFTSTKSGTMTSAPSDTNGSPLLWFKQEGALVGSGLNTSITLAEFNITDTGNINNTDSYVAITGNCNLTTARSGAGFTGCIGGNFGSRGFASQGGGVGTEKGEIHGLNVVSGLSPGAVNYYDSIVAEFDQVGCATCSLNIRIGLYLVDFGDGAGGLAQQGRSVDAALAISTVGGSVGWKYGIDFLGLPFTSANALSNTGTVLGSSAATPVVASYGIDLNNFLISPNTNPAFRGPGGTFLVTGAGDMVSNSSSSKSFIADTELAVSGTLQFRTGGVGNWDVAREATSQDFIIKNTGGLTYFRIDAALGGTSIGPVDGISIDATGSVVIPGVSTSVGTIAGSVCMDANKVLIYKVGANCI